MPAKMPHPRRGERGSVLTEFLIVAPLYLLLLGSLMLLQDAMRVRGRVKMLDVLLTAAGGHRFTEQETKDRLEKHYIPQSLATFAPGSVKMQHAHVDIFQSDEGKEGAKRLSNGWCAVYGGRVDLRYKMPDFIYSLMAVQQVVFGEGVPENKPIDFFADDSAPYRFHFLQRHGGQGMKRTAPAKDLLAKGILSQVLLDGWLFAEGTQSVSLDEQDNQADTDYTQQLGKYAE